MEIKTNSCCLEFDFKNIEEVNENANAYNLDKRYKYVRKTESFDELEYNYDVRSSTLVGNITMIDKYGSGTLESSTGNEIEITAEWLNSQDLIAKDQEGNLYDLEIY